MLGVKHQCVGDTVLCTEIVTIAGINYRQIHMSTRIGRVLQQEFLEAKLGFEVITRCHCRDCLLIQGPGSGRYDPRIDRLTIRSDFGTGGVLARSRRCPAASEYNCQQREWRQPTTSPG